MTRTRSAPHLLRAAGALAAAALAAVTVATPAQADAPRGRTERVSVGLGQRQPDGASNAAGLSADGRFAVFTSKAANLVPGDTNGKSDVLVRNQWTGRTERVSVATDGSQAAGASERPFVDALGTTVLFTSEDGTLVPGDTNQAPDVFLRRLPLL